jgi:hypothetical protein
MMQAAETSEIVHLPEPGAGAAASVFAALQWRKTTREISPAPISRQQLSDLLWSACGVNRPNGPFGLAGRTAASASNSQEIDVYVATEEGAYRYDAFRHRLVPVAAGDLRRLALTPHQPIGSRAPVQLIYVVDIDRLVHTRGFQEPGLHDPEVQKSYYFVDTGLIAQNVYLFAAAEGLACWFHNCDRTRLGERLGLSAMQRVLFAQSVGFPMES